MSYLPLYVCRRLFSLTHCSDLFSLVRCEQGNSVFQFSDEYQLPMFDACLGKSTLPPTNDAKTAQLLIIYKIVPYEQLTADLQNCHEFSPSQPEMR